MTTFGRGAIMSRKCGFEIDENCVRQMASLIDGSRVAAVEVPAHVGEHGVWVAIEFVGGHDRGHLGYGRTADVGLVHSRHAAMCRPSGMDRRAAGGVS